MKAKTPKESLAVTTKVVLPNDTNMLDNLYGGNLLHWMDNIAAISAHRHCKRVVVTASVNHVEFRKPIELGSIVTMEAKVSRAFNSSME
ncbi:MAG: acyl-CoA thioesterase, partial [Flavobacteriaceae bacterium]